MGPAVGGGPSPLAGLPVATFLDKGQSVEEGGKYSEPYEKAFASGQHRVIAAGDKIAVKGLEVTVLTAAGRAITRNCEANPSCDGLNAVESESGENPQS